MRVEAQDFLRMVERLGTLVFWDTESSSLSGDYGRLLVSSIKPFGKPVLTYKTERRKDGSVYPDKRIAQMTKFELEQADCWVTYYGKGHDVPLLNTRLLYYGLPPVEPRPHLDLYFLIKHKTKTGRRSQAHMLEFLQEAMRVYKIRPERKLSVSPSAWSDLYSDFHSYMPVLVRRCESDVTGLESLYRVTKHLAREINR